MPAVNPSSSEKSYLRAFFKEQRQKLAEDQKRKNSLDDEIQARLLCSREYRDANTVLLYMARPFEISCRLIMYAGLANHKAVGLPVCMDDNRMIFRRVRSFTDVSVGRYGILEPKESCEALTFDEKTLCVCPALCCDMRGYRLGFGGGWYDRFLADFPGVKAALCYADSLIPVIREDSYDVKMNVIHTDSFTRTMKW